MKRIPIPTFVLITLFIIFFGSAIFLGLNSEPSEPSGQETTVIEGKSELIFDDGIDIGDRVMTIDFAQPRTLVLEGEPRMVSPQAVIDFSGDKVTYSGDLPIDESARIFFDFVMGFVIEARECK